MLQMKGQYTHTFKVNTKLFTCIVLNLVYTGKGFPHIPKMLGSYTCEAYDVILIEKVNGEHIEYLSNKLEVTLYEYKLLKASHSSQ